MQLHSQRCKSSVVKRRIVVVVVVFVVLLGERPHTHIHATYLTFSIYLYCSLFCRFYCTPGRVYGILTGQLAVTAAIVTAFDRNPQWSRWMTHSGVVGPAIPALSLLLSTIAWYTMSKSANARRKAPLKWNLLALFTLGEAVSVGFITSFFKFHSVVKTMGITGLATAVVGLYTILNKNPKRDLSQWGHTISSCGMVILSFGIEHLLELVGVLPHGFMPYSDFWYSAASACLFCAYLAYHTRLIVA